VDALGDSDATVRLNVIGTLGRYGPMAQRAAAGLGNLLAKDGMRDVRRKAAEALGLIGPEAQSAVPAILEAMQKDKEVDVRRWAAIALTKIGVDGKESASAALKTLTEILNKEPDRFVRGYAAHALGKFGKEAIAPLKKCAESDVTVEVRLAAIEELGTIGPDAKDDAVIALLKSYTRDSRPAVKEAAETALKKIMK
jgi:HEAT repeat protein